MQEIPHLFEDEKVVLLFFLLFTYASQTKIKVGKEPMIKKNK